MSDDKKKKIVTDEDVSKLLDDLLGDIPSADKAAADAATRQGQVQEEDYVAPTEEISPLEEAPAHDSAHEEPDTGENFYVEQEVMNPKLEAALERAEKARARAEAMAGGAAVAYEKTRRAVDPVVRILGRDEEARRANLKALWGYIGFGAALFCGLVFLIYIYIAITLSGEHQYKEQFIASVKKMTGHEMIIEGNVDFELFPQPRFVVGAAQLRNLPGAHRPYMLTVKGLELRPSFFWLALNTIKVKEAVLHDPVLNLEHFNGEVPNWQWYGKDVTWYGGGGQTVSNKGSADELLSEIENYLGGANLVLENMKVTYSSGLKTRPIERNLQMDNVRLRANSLHGPFNVAGTFSTPAVASTFHYTLKIDDLLEEKPAINFSVNMNNFVVAMQGSVEGSGKQRVVTGKLTSSVKKSSALGNIAMPQMLSGMFSEGGSSLLEGDFEASGKKIGLKNVKVNSSHASGELNVDFIFGAPNIINLSLKGERLDLDQLLGESKEKEIQKKSAQLQASLSELVLGLDLPRDIMVRLDTTIKAFTYRKQTIPDFRTDVQIGSNSMILRAINLENLPGNTVIKAASKPNEQGKFAGKIGIRSDDFHQFLTWIGREPGVTAEKLKDFRFESSAVMSEQELLLENFILHFGGSNVSGNVKLTANKGIIADTVLNIDTFKLNETSGKAVISANASQQDLFAPLRHLDLWFEKLNIALTVDKLEQGKQTFEHVSAKGVFSEGLSEFTELNFESKFGKVGFSGKVNHKQLKPQLDIALEVEKIDLNDLGEMLGMDLTKKSRTRWSEQLVRVDRLSGYEGTVKLKIGTLSYREFKAEEVSSQFKLESEKMTLKDFRAKLFDSRLKVDGSVVTNDQPSANLTFSLANADTNAMLHQLFGFGAIEGKANITGSVTMSGLSPFQWISTMQGSVNFVSRGIRIKGFNLEMLVQRLPILQSVKEVQYWVPRALYSGQTDFVFATGGGKIVQGVFTMTDIILRGALLPKYNMVLRLNLPEWKMQLQSDMIIGRDIAGYPTSLKNDTSIDQPALRWDQKPIEATWEKLFYAGAFSTKK